MKVKGPTKRQMRAILSRVYVAPVQIVVKTEDSEGGRFVDHHFQLQADDRWKLVEHLRALASMIAQSSGFDGGCVVVGLNSKVARAEREKARKVKA